MNQQKKEGLIKYIFILYLLHIAVQLILLPVIITLAGEVTDLQDPDFMWAVFFILIIMTVANFLYNRKLQISVDRIEEQQEVTTEKFEKAWKIKLYTYFGTNVAIGLFAILNDNQVFLWLYLLLFFIYVSLLPTPKRLKKTIE
jgi:hypothetical protein